MLIKRTQVSDSNNFCQLFYKTNEKTYNLVKGSGRGGSNGTRTTPPGGSKSNPTGKIPQEDLRGSKEERNYSRASDRGFPKGSAQGIKAAVKDRIGSKLNQEKQNRQFNKINKAPDIRANANRERDKDTQKQGGKIPQHLDARVNDKQSKAAKMAGKLPGVGRQIQQAQQIKAAVQDPKAAMNALVQQAKTQLKQAVKKLVKEAVKKAVITAVSNPYTMAIVGAIGGFFLIVILIIALLIAIFTKQQVNNTPQAPNPLQLEKSGPNTANVGDILTYTLTVIYPLSAQDIQVTDTVPAGTTYVSSSWKDVVQGTTVTWSVLDNLPGNPKNVSNVNQTFTFKVRSNKNNLTIANIASATVIGAISAGGMYFAPSKSTCNGQYVLNNPLGENFGDPQCDFTKDQLYSLIQTNDAQYIHQWFDIIAAGESSYNPDAYNPDTPANGAWGLFQMGQSHPPGQPPPAQGTNGIYDRGDVNWQLQTTNAINYNEKVLKCAFTYWQTAAGFQNQFRC